MSGAVGHVLVARLDNAGDVLLAGPAVRAACGRAARVTVLCGPADGPPPSCCPGSTRSWCSTRRGSPSTPRPHPAPPPTPFVDRIASLVVDQAFVLTSFHQSPLPCAAPAARRRPGRRGDVGRLPGSLLDVRHHVVEGAHEVEQSLSLLASLGHVLPPG
jgi:hypothetical protein